MSRDEITKVAKGLTEPQKTQLLESPATAAKSYKPAAKLVTLGLAEWRTGRYGEAFVITPSASPFGTFCGGRIMGSFLTSKEVAARLMISDRTLRKLRQDSEIRYIAMTDHKILYRPEDCDEYMNSRARKETKCPSIKPTVHHIGSKTSAARGKDFMAQLDARRSAMRSGSKPS
jgi:hypothetical protein